jgi:hypothetical protein
MTLVLKKYIKKLEITEHILLVVLVSVGVVVTMYVKVRHFFTGAD